MKDNCKLKMLSMAYDNFRFNRLGQKNDKYADIGFMIDIKRPKHSKLQNTFKVNLTAHVKKEGEYNLDLTVSGLFEFDESMNEKDDAQLKRCSVGILMPYLRAELSLLTAQPDTECIVVPPFDIGATTEHSTHAIKFLHQHAQYHWM